LFYSDNIDVTIFEQMKILSMEYLNASKHSQPYEKIFVLFSKIIKNKLSIYSDMLPITDQVDYKSYSEIIRKIQKSFLINSLFYGYLKTDNLTKIKDYIVKKTTDFKVVKDTTINPKIPIDATYIKPSFKNDYLTLIHDHHEISGSYIINVNNDLKSEVNHAIVNFYQVRLLDYLLIILLIILITFINLILKFVLGWTKGY